jgi:hypothetical protein
MSWNGKPTTVVVPRPDPERERAAAVKSEVTIHHWTPEEVQQHLTTRYGRKLDRPLEPKVSNYGW